MVTIIPLEELWDDAGPFGRRVTYLTIDDVKAILKLGPVRFAEADIGASLRWSAREDCYARWKEISPYLADPDSFLIQGFPDERAFVASEWEGRLAERLLVFEVHH